ncbi:MAG: hypothetical protein AB4206_08220 [Xenococcaceae cyanobacterium]
MLPKKVTLEIEAENGIKVKAELNRKTLKKQVAKMEEYSNWVGALSGKVKSISIEGTVELESAGIQVFEKKTSDKEAKKENSGAKSQVEEVKSSPVTNAYSSPSLYVNQTLKPEQLGHGSNQGYKIKSIGGLKTENVIQHT